MSQKKNTSKVKKKVALEILSSMFPSISREKLMAQILTGDWLFNGIRERNPKALYDINALKVLPRDTNPFVSRGGIKLEGALKDLDLISKVKDCAILDAGSSTGGFTHCLLTYGASCVYACDVGTNQLDWHLRNHPKVRVYEKTNVMNLPRLINTSFLNWAVCDISFRSSVSVVKAIMPILRDKWMLVLIKPQFECKGYPNFYKGIVPKDMYRPILNDVGNRLRERGFFVKAISPSSLRGKKQGNQEFFYWITSKDEEGDSYKIVLEEALEKVSI